MSTDVSISILKRPCYNSSSLSCNWKCSRSSTSNCSSTVLPITAQGTTVVTWTFEDTNGNISTQTQNVIINDVTAPVVDVVNLEDVTAECSVDTLTAPTATDNCAGTITGTT